MKVLIQNNASIPPPTTELITRTTVPLADLFEFCNASLSALRGALSQLWSSFDCESNSSADAANVSEARKQEVFQQKAQCLRADATLSDLIILLRTLNNTEGRLGRSNRRASETGDYLVMLTQNLHERLAQLVSNSEKGECNKVMVLKTLGDILDDYYQNFTLSVYAIRLILIIVLKEFKANR